MKEYEKWREFKDSPVAGAPTECWINAVEIVSGLACIAHKSLEIFERCRLWQQNSPATPDNSAAFFERTISNSLF
jgi:hypothetical protein